MEHTLLVKFTLYKLTYLVGDSILFKGRSIYYVHAERGGGGLKNCPNLRMTVQNDSTDRLREMRTKGREGVQNPENFANIINGCSLTGNRCC